MEYSLFRKEKEILARAEELTARRDCGPRELKEGLFTLIAALRQNYREQKRLLRVGDRLQEQLRAMKEELLAKTAQLERQALDLQVLNENLNAEIAIRKEAEERLRVMANTDALTGLNNRRRFLELLEEEIRKADRTGRPLCLMMLDIDSFKKVNDRFGHAAGDRVLQHFAGALLSVIREIDRAGRLGGEEFGVLLPETSADQAYPVAARIKSTVENRAVSLAVEKIKITVSIGLAELKPKEPGEQLLSRADAAMYRAKAKGRNQVEADW